MDIYPDDSKLLSLYCDDNEFFGIFRINSLINLPDFCQLSDKKLIGWQKILDNVSLDYDKSFKEVLPQIPEIWIRNCLEFLDSNSDFAYLINIYASDVMWLALIDRIKTKQWNSLFDQVDNVISKCPQTDQSFTAFRGIRSDHLYKIGESIIFDTPKSASFVTIHCEKHMGDEGCIMSIDVPKGLHLAYHESEDQVIFPIGTKLEIVDIILNRTFAIGNHKTYITKIVVEDHSFIKI